MAAKQTKKATENSPAPDRRWSILLFGLGILFAALVIFPGESAWGWVRQNMIFGIFGIGGWLLGPLFMFWGVWLGLQKPLLPMLVKSLLLLFALCGVALVFGSGDYSGLSFGEWLQALHRSAQTGGFAGGVAGALFGGTLMAIAGRTGARILMVILLVVALMLITGVTPADVVGWISSGIQTLQEKRRQAEEERPARQPKQHRPAPPEEAYEEYAVPEQPALYNTQQLELPEMPAPPPVQTRRDFNIDIDIGPVADSQEGGSGQFFDVEIGPGGTFGRDAAQPAEAGEPAGDVSEIGFEGELLPFGPPKSEQEDAGEPPEPKKLLLFNEDDPYVHLGGANSALPDGTLYDVEYVPSPAPDPDFDIFHQQPKEESASGETPADVGQPPQQPDGPAVLPASDMRAGDAQGADGAAGETQPAADGTVQDVEALIDREAAPKLVKLADADAPPKDIFADYERPSLNLLHVGAADNTAGAREEMKRTAELLVTTLASFGVETRILDVSRGPSVTRYEVQPQTGVKISRITSLADDIALNLAVAGVRIEAPIPGKPAVGIEVPNRRKNTVWARNILESSDFADIDTPLPLALGKDIGGEVVVADLTKMPHLLIAGATGSGKSVCVNATIISFLYKSSPEDVRMILIDPKVVELAEYNGIPHLLIPVVTEPTQAAKALGYAVNEMEKRYHLFAEHGVRDIASFNKKALRSREEKLPHIVIVIDELADLMRTAGKDVETYICRIAQKARAAGMHLIVATQRPSVDVITGLIKSNIPSRIAFATSSQIDSRTILDGPGAEKLLGNGDMLFMPLGANKPLRVQGAFVKNKEISNVIRAVKNQAGAQYDENVQQEMNKIVLASAPGASERDEEDDADILQDPTFVSAVQTALENGQISTSFLQRRLRLGYARAGRIMDQMEQMKIISPPDGSKPREVLITTQQWQEMVINVKE